VRTAYALAVFAAVTAACSTGGPLTARHTRTESTAPPKPFVEHLAAQWKGAALSARATAACDQSGSPAQNAGAAFVSGDFDGDGIEDVAAPVKRDDGLHVVAGLQHTYDYAVVDVTDKPDESADRVTVRPRGTMYNVPDSGVDYYFGTDTLVLEPCGKAPTAYLWNGEAFEPQTLAK
jgi:hypothetical protein